MEKEKEKQSKLMRNKFLKAITVTFQNAPFSPGRDHKFRSAKTHAAATKGFSAPVVTMIPYEARRKPKDDGATETQEPTSPKISCMGQIKHHKKKHTTAPPKYNSIPLPTQKHRDTDEVIKMSKFQRIFSHRSKSKFAERKSSDDNYSGFSSGEGKNAPPMGDMRRFASGRDTFANFDWRKAVIEPDEIDQRDCYTDGEDDEILIPFSAPILGGGSDNTTSSNLKFKPRDEINLWKRRTMARPRPLQLNPVLKAK